MTLLRRFALAAMLAFALAPPVRATDTLCDPSFENCRTQLLSLIANEKVEIDVGFWFMTDTQYVTAIVNRFKAGVPVRILVDTRANPTYSGNSTVIADFANAHIPIRNRTKGGILHWKTMIFAGQETVEFGSAEFSVAQFIPSSPYTNYVAETIYYTDDPSVVNSFKTEFDSSWIDTTSYVNYANISGSLTRHYPVYTLDPDLNFPPSQNYATRAIAAYNNEHSKIDAIMFRITDARQANAIIEAKQAGVPVRMIIENKEYRTAQYLWDAYNVDRLYMAGVPLRWRGHTGQNHEKVVLLYGQGLAIFGSSNWTSASANYQQEHNYFTTKSGLFTWFADQFNRMWTNAVATETVAFAPLPPDKPVNESPSNGSTTGSTSVTLKWYAGPWGQKYDIYLGTSTTPPRVVANDQLGPSTTSTTYQHYTFSLASHTTYHWYVVSKTMANKTAVGPVWSFTTP